MEHLSGKFTSFRVSYYLDNKAMAETVNEFTSDDGRANDGGRIIVSQAESFLPRQSNFSSASMDFAGRNRGFGDRLASANFNSALPDLTISGSESPNGRPGSDATTIASADLSGRVSSSEYMLGMMNLNEPIPILPRTNEAANFLSPAFRAPSLQELSNRRQLSGDLSLNTVARSKLGSTEGSSLDRLSRSALDYVSRNAEQLRRSTVRGPFEGSRGNAQRYLPNVSITGPPSSSYALQVPQGNWQQYNGGFQSCPCPNCASGAYRPDAGPRPYQQQPWAPARMTNFSGYDPRGGFDPNAGMRQPEYGPRPPQYGPRPNNYGPSRFDSMVPPAGDIRMRSNRVTPDMMPPGWFEEIYGSPNSDRPQPRPGPQDRPRPGPRPTERPRPPGNFDMTNLPPPRPDLVQPGVSDIRMLSEPSISPEKIDEVLRHYRSPAVGVGRELYALGVRYGIDPAIALGFFIVESTAGRHGRASRNMSWGNIKGRGPAGSDGTFRRYNSWAEGAEDWFRLIRHQYVATQPNEHHRRPFGAETLRAVIRRYAPGSDGNNEGGYVRQVISMRQRWAREMMAQQPAQQPAQQNRYAQNDR